MIELKRNELAGAACLIVSAATAFAALALWVREATWAMLGGDALDGQPDFALVRAISLLLGLAAVFLMGLGFRMLWAVHVAKS